MRTTEQFSITLPTKTAQMVRERVASGEYASESEVIRDGLRALMARDQALERWLREDVVRSYDAVMADPSLLRTPDQVRAALAAARDRLAARKEG